MSATAIALKMPGVGAVPRHVSTESRPIYGTRYLEDPAELAHWRRPDFQRPLIKNDEVVMLACKMQLEAASDRDGMCTIPGTIEFGRVRGVDWLIDGQHRLFGAFLIASGVVRLPNKDAILVHGGALAKCALMDTKTTPYESMAEMSDAFAEFNRKLVALKSDDLLRAREGKNPYLLQIREECPFIGYTKNSATKDTIMLSMSAAIRTWFGSGGVPASGPNAESAQRMLDEEETRTLCDFFLAAEAAGWVGNFHRLWSTGNLGVNMWLWRKMVLGAANKLRGGGTCSALTKEQYTDGMIELRKSAEYQSDLAGRSLRYQDRMPIYDGIKKRFQVALARHSLIGVKWPLPQGWEEDK